MEKLMSFVSRLFFIVAFIFLVMATLDWILRLFGWTFSWVSYQPGRMFEFSAILMIFVMVLLLRQIRDRISS
jgi:hypothetical protein